MSVELWFAPTTRFPGGHKSTFDTLEEAIAQAKADLASERHPAPVRVQDASGDVIAGRADFEDAD